MVTEAIYAFENYLVPVKVMMCIAVITVFISVATNLAFMAGLPTFFLEGVAQTFSGKQKDELYKFQYNKNYIIFQQ